LKEEEDSIPHLLKEPNGSPKAKKRCLQFFKGMDKKRVKREQEKKEEKNRTGPVIGENRAYAVFKKAKSAGLKGKSGFPRSRAPSVSRESQRI